MAETRDKVKTVKVNSDLHAELKAKAAKEKKPLEVVVDETLKKGLKGTN